jgi:hypothetical protein
VRAGRPRRGEGSVDGSSHADEYKGEPIPGGPTDPDAPELAGERRKRENQQRMHGD